MLLSLLASLAGCAQPYEGRVAHRLEQAGIPKGMAECMAKRWVDRLSVFQLRKIQSLTDDLNREHREGTLTVLGLVERARQVDDPEIFKVVSKSAAICTLEI